MEYSIGYWMSFLMSGLVIGWLAGLITRGRGFGIAGDIGIGVLGAIVGGWLANSLGIVTYNNTVGAFVVALFGAVLLVGVTRFVKRIA